jgi:hypothetical protein
MSFHATNYTVSIVLLMAATIFMIGVRLQKPLENNWPLLYWILLTLICFRYPDDTFDPRVVMAGLGAGLLLRFEFISSAVTTFVRFVELCVWGYILYMGFILVTTR